MDIGRMVGQLWRLLTDDEKEVVALFIVAECNLYLCTCWQLSRLLTIKMETQMTV